MTDQLAQIAQRLAETADALLAHVNGQAAAIPTQHGTVAPQPDLYNPFYAYADHIRAVQKACPNWRTNIPSAAVIGAVTSEDFGEIVDLVRRMLAALAAFEDDDAPVGAPKLPSIRKLAADLDKRFPGRTIGRPKALAYLRSVYGSCSGDRADKAKNLHNARVTAV